MSSIHGDWMTPRSTSPRRDRPLADRARDASEELEPDAPTVTALADKDRPPAEGIDPEGFDAALLAGVAAAGEMDRAAGTHVAPEHPAEERPAEIDVDTIVAADGRPIGSVADAERLEGRAARPEEPRPLLERTGSERATPVASLDQEELDPAQAEDMVDAALGDELDLDQAPPPSRRR